MEGFRDWYNEHDEVRRLRNASLAFPVGAEHCAENDDKACFEEALVRFASDPTVYMHGNRLLSNYEQWKPFLWADEAANGGPRLRFVVLEVETELKVTMSYTDGIAVHHAWESWLNQQLQLAGSYSAATQERFASGSVFNAKAFHYFYLQEKLVGEAFAGIGISIALSLVVLTLATRNVIVSLFATLSIACIVICMVGFTVMMGWRLGVMETINLILVPGLAVDYTVHLADAYLSSRYDSRQERVADMLAEVGVSILSGAVSTMGSGLVMYGAPIAFFSKFATYILVTITLSITFSLGFFTCLLAVAGPQGDFGSFFLPRKGKGNEVVFAESTLVPQPSAPLLDGEDVELAALGT
jgi:hypothetical protein